jgi:HJR/Mrr/RecB family endonuclease
MARRHALTDSIDLGDLVHQISALRRDLTGSSRSLVRSATHTAADFGEDLLHQGERVARGVGKQAMRAGHAIQKDPVPTVVALAGFACLMSLILASKRS